MNLDNFSYKNDICSFLSSEMKIMINIEFGPNDAYQFATRLVGYKPYHYLIIDYPHAVQEALVVRSLNNANVVMRGMSDTELGHIIAFKTSIAQISHKPFPMLFLRMPRHFVTKPIRQHKRIKISLPATINERKGERKIDGTLVDFSVTGCGIFVGKQSYSEEDNFLTKERYVSVHSSLTECIEHPLDIRIANIVKQPEGHFVGLHFSKALPFNDQLKHLLFEHTFLEHLT
jgi:c-di-GMP-binding flagellar brake protein YcgR